MKTGLSVFIFSVDAVSRGPFGPKAAEKLETAEKCWWFCGPQRQKIENLRGPKLGLQSSVRDDCRTV